MNLWVMVGLPGSGKSTYAKGLAAAHANSVIISRDDVRFKMLKEGEDYFAHEKQVFNEFIDEINKSYETYDNIIVDATHLNFASRAKVLNKVRPPRSCALHFVVMDTPIQVCKTRNALRTGRKLVPDSTIDQMAAGFRFPSAREFYDDNFGFDSIVISVVK